MLGTEFSDHSGVRACFFPTFKHPVSVRMYRLLFAIALFVISMYSHSASGADEQLVATLLTKREALVANNRVDISAMSKDIRSAINEGERLERANQYSQSLQRLNELQRYAPLLELPSFDVHMLSSWLYMKLGDTTKSSEHQARAAAMQEILLRRIGRGGSPEDPIRAMMVSDIAEWARVQLAKIADIKTQTYKGREIIAVTYKGPGTKEVPALAYFEIDPRVTQRTNARLSLFAPIPLAQMRPQDREMFDLANAKRERFLSDTNFPYLELIDKVKMAVNKATQLDMQGNAKEALEALKEVESIRPIEEIPLFTLISTYSFLNGKLGNTEKQTHLRGLIFGINQVMAHSGDALTPETAIHVIAIEEEYGWLSDKKLTRVKQVLIDTPQSKLDVITAKDSVGSERDYYFDVTRLHSKYLQNFQR